MNPQVDEFVQHLRERLSWPRVEAVDIEGTLWIACRPDNPSHESIGLWIDRDLECVQAVGMGVWHYHPETLEEAVVMMGTLIRGEQWILEQYSTTGRYKCSGPEKPGTRPDTLPLDIGWMIERPFNQEPRRREVDLSGYVRGRYDFVDPGYKERTEKLWRELGINQQL